MRFFKRSSHSGDAEQRADELADRAHELAQSAPGSEVSQLAAAQAVEAAEQLLAAEPTLINLRRTARGLWRQSEESFPGEADAAAVAARRCWRLAVQAVEQADPDDPLRNQVIGELMLYSSAVIPVLAQTGYQEEALELVHVCEAAVNTARGPEGRQAKARLVMLQLVNLPDQFVAARLGPAWDEAQEHELARTITMGLSLIHELRRYQDDGPFEVTEVALMLVTVSRLLTVSAELMQAAQALDEAIRLLRSVADHGPRYQTFLENVIIERSGLDGQIPEPSTAPEPSALERLFAAAATSVDLNQAQADEAASASVEQATALVERLRAEVVMDPGRFGPQLALGTVALAWSLLRAGQPEPAQARADEAARELGRFSDEPERVQPALVVALTVLALAAGENGQTDAAVRAQQRADAIAELVAARGVSRSPGITASADGRGREELVDEYSAGLEAGLRMFHRGEFGPAAESFSKSVDAFTLLWEPGSRARLDLELNRKLVQATWRLALSRHFGGSPVEGLSSGQAALEAARTLLAVLSAKAPERVEITVELVKVATDVAELTFLSGDSEAGFTILDEATEWLAIGDHPALRPPFGTVLHNRATALFNALQRTAPNPVRAQQHLRDLMTTAEQAVVVRRQVWEAENAVSRYELANSLVLLSTVEALVGDAAAAVGHLAEATEQAAPLVPDQDVEALWAKIFYHAAGLEQAVPPADIAVHRARGHWPT